MLAAAGRSGKQALFTVQLLVAGEDILCSHARKSSVTRGRRLVDSLVTYLPCTEAIARGQADCVEDCEGWIFFLETVAANKA